MQEKIEIPGVCVVSIYEYIVSARSTEVYVMYAHVRRNNSRRQRMPLTTILRPGSLV